MAGESSIILPDEGEGAQDGYYSLSIDEKGIHLTVYPPQGGGLFVNETVIITELEQKKIKNYNRQLITKAVKEAAGTAVTIAQPHTEIEPEIKVIIARDRMEAMLEVVRTPYSRAVEFDEVLAKIQAAGIVYGIDHEAVHKAYKRPGLRVVCARGLKPKDGTNAYIKYLVDLTNKGRPAELSDGRVDYKNLNTFTIVCAGQVLAEKVPATKGEPGTDILGQPVNAKAGKDIRLPLGKNVHADGDKVIASMAGQFIISGNKINVIPVIEVNGDIDFSTGNIDFVGSVIVHGSVQPGFVVKAGGNVEIMGTVSGGTVEGKNILIRMGIQGMNRGSIKASEHVYAKFIENATVYAGKDVIANEVILHSHIHAGGKVIVKERRGLISGGRITAGLEIHAKTIGTQFASSTHLEVGINPMLREEYRSLRTEFKKAQISLDQAQKALNILRAMDQDAMSAAKRQMLLKLTKAQFHLIGQTETMKNRIAEIEQEFEQMRNGRILVADVMYAGVKITIGSLVKLIREPVQHASLYVEDGEIKLGPYN